MRNKVNTSELTSSEGINFTPQLFRNIVEGAGVLYIIPKGCRNALDKILRTKPPTENKIVHRKNHDKSLIRFEYFLGLMVRRGANDCKDYDGSQYINLCASYLDDILTDYKHRLDYLIKHGFIECDNDFEPKSKCKGYRFAAKYQGVGFEVVYHNDAKFKKQISKTSAKEQSKKYQFLNEKYNELDIEYVAGAKLINEDLKTNNIINLSNTFHHLRGIHNPKLMTWKVGKTGRLYNPITSIKKNYRNILKYKNTKLIGLDIGNSIPLISTLLFKEEIEHTSRSIYKRTLDCNPRLKNKTNNPLILREIYTEDAYEYVQLVESNAFYEHMSKAWKTDHGVELNRKQAKTKFLECIFKPTKMDCKYTKTIEKEFPHVYEVFKNINIGFTRTQNGAGLNKRRKGDMDCPLAKLLQGIEAYLILDKVCGNLNLKHPQMPLYTIHDCVATTEPYLEFLRQEIKVVYSKEMACIPKLKEIRDWELD